MPCEGFVMKKLQLTSQTLQQGAALIAVLIVLLIVTVLGITAMRMGLSSLALANNSQMSQLLFQTADMGTVAYHY
jgi:Tfp pilus assembly protein PilX